MVLVTIPIMENKTAEDHVEDNTSVTDITLADGNLHEDLSDTKSDHTTKTLSLKAEKNSEILSSQYGINIFVIGLLLMLLCSFDITGMSSNDWMVFLVVLVLIQILWMFWYIFISHRYTRNDREKDSHAGARWLRCGIALFAITTLVMDILKLGYFIGYLECMELIEGIFPATHIIHTIVQVYFLWYHSKDVIKSFKTLERFGLIHSVFTNLLLWASAVATESKHQLVEHMERLVSLGFTNLTLRLSHPHCNCTTGLCDEFSKGTYYIYPFKIEYHILASAMLYVLWKNTGRCITHHQPTPHLKFQGVVVGAIFGLIVLGATIGVVVLYLFNIGRTKHNSESALSIYYLYSVSVLTVMCIAAFAGLILQRLDRKPAILEESPSLKLDEELLVGSACGSWIMSWGSILAIIYAENHPVYTWHNLPYSILVLTEKYVQNLFIATYICRKAEKISTDENGKSSVLPLQLVLPTDQNNVEQSDGSDVGENGSVSGDDIARREKEKTNSVSPSNHVTSSNTNSEKQPIRKQLLKNITIALFICNISLWIPPAFGCRPQYDNGLEAFVFGFIPWIVIIDIALPFSIFYRMHSAYSLFDVYCKI
uniref:Uncharacterized protein n=1 Tax=Leptobrachium leishanense TaxID=445787 RepID=A0A8C5LPX3_9ANUR